MSLKPTNPRHGRGVVAVLGGRGFPDFIERETDGLKLDKIQQSGCVRFKNAIKMAL
jgi:hypothetical protein